jgi:hypothetical protein
MLSVEPSAVLAWNLELAVIRPETEKLTRNR